MNKKLVAIILGIIGVAVFISSIVFFSEFRIPSRKNIDLRYTDPQLPIDERIEILLSQMTLEEKIGQMALVDKNSVEKVKDVTRYELGAILSGGGSKPENNTPQGWYEMVEEFMDASRRSRLGIPILYGVDSVHGHGNVPGATLFPHSIGLGAINDVDLVKKVATATAKEVDATGISWVFSPNLDTPEDIRWGRVYETFSSDTAINTKLGVAYTEGTQDIKVLATAKHYLGAGGMQWDGSGNSDFKIDQGITKIDEKKLRQIYLPPFKAVIDAGALSVMAGLNTYGDEKISASKYLLTDILKKELGFKGFVVSDWHGIYEIPGGKYTASIVAINAGMDMVMLPFDYKTFVDDVKKAVEEGNIPESRIDDAVRRILYAKFSIGLFEKNFSGNGESAEVGESGENTSNTESLNPAKKLEIIGSADHRLLAREAVSKSLVLLQNKNRTLPINPNIKQIVVAGSASDNTGIQSGAWTIEWQGVDGNVIPGATSILEGIKQIVGSSTSIIYDKEANFQNTPNTLFDPQNQAELGIAIVGEKPYAEGWGDNENPTLSEEDLETINNLRKISERLVVVIVSGRPLILPPEFRDWDAIVAAWLPGSEGGGVADVLFGKKPFVGKLPLPWPATIAQLPFSHSGLAKDRTRPLFPRGFGL